MNGDYRFLRVKAGVSHFAHVGVEMTPGGTAREVVDDTPRSVNRDSGEANRPSAPSWVSAALDGMREVLDAAARAGVGPAGYRAALVKLVGTAADTRDDVVRCAAGLATWQALGSPEPVPEAVYSDDAWSLHFPNRVARPDPAAVP